MHHRIDTTDQLRQCRAIAEITGNDLRIQVAPLRAHRITAQQQAHAPAGGGEQRRETAADEPGAAGQRRDRPYVPAWRAQFDASGKLRQRR